jgi:phosphotriesterase-related protein
MRRTERKVTSMSDATAHRNDAVNTVLGPIPASNLGVIAIHESLLSVVPGAQYAHDITLDQAEIFEVIAAKLTSFKAAGGGTIVDSTGMFHGRDLPLLEALARSTGVNIIASTGMGPEEYLGGYFLTPQTNPPTPWPAEKFAELLSQELNEGMVVPRLERRAPAGLVISEADRAGITPTEVSLFKGSARAARANGVALSIRWGADAMTDLAQVLEEGIPADRVIVAGLDRSDAKGIAARVAALGAYVAIDHVGQNTPDFIDDNARAALVAELVAAGHADRILLSSGSIGFAAGLAAVEVPFEFVLKTFVPALHAAGVPESVVLGILVDNPREVLTVRAGKGA